MLISLPNHWLALICRASSQSVRIKFGTMMAAMLVATACLAANPATAGDTSVPAHDLIDALDVKFMDLYDSSRSDLLGHGDPVIVFHKGAVTLLNHGQVVAKESYLPQQFQTLKTVDHITLGIFIALVDRPDRLTDKRVQQLKEFRAAAVAARPQVEAEQLNAEQKERQERIFDQSIAFMDRVIENLGCTGAQLNEYMLQIRGPAYANIKDAVALDLSALDRAVKKLLALLSAEELKQLRVVVFGSHMARSEESHMQYFSRLLDEPLEGKRIIYFEGAGEDKDGLALLGAHLVDTQIGRSYFGAAWRMHRDLLSAAASQYLDEHPVK